MKIGILYICTGKYIIFWKDFYLSCEKYFISKAEIHYFVFTDADEIEFEKTNTRIHRIPQVNLGWPNNTLMRYDIFLNSKDKLETMDYLFFFNANIIFIKDITASEFLPSGIQKLVGCLHPGYYNKNKDKFDYDNNPLSTACIKKGEGYKYFAGGINGGETRYFLNTIKTLNENINTDSRNGVLAKWHDESHWNWYLNNHYDIIKILDPSYLFFPKLKLPLEPKIILRDKSTLGGHAKFRNKFEIRLMINSLKEFIKKIIN
jgi:hypothetical protein